MSNKIEKTELEKKLEAKMAENIAAGETAAMEPNDASNGACSNTETSNGETATALQKLEEKTSECEQMKDQLLRARADFDNYRKRMLREMEQIRQTASAKLICALLPALDNLERALAHATAEEGFVEGVGMVYKQFQETLSTEGLEPIPALHETFDPNVHDALATVPSENVEAGRIVEEYERGYRLREAVLRPSRVIVSSGPPEIEDTEPKAEQDTEEIETTE